MLNSQDKRGVEGHNYLEILTEVSKSFNGIARPSKDFRQEIDTVGVIRFVADTPQRDSANIRSMGLPKYAEESCEVALASMQNEIYTTTVVILSNRNQ